MERRKAVLNVPHEEIKLGGPRVPDLRNDGLIAESPPQKTDSRCLWRKYSKRPLHWKDVPPLLEGKPHKSWHPSQTVERTEPEVADKIQTTFLA